MAPPSTDADQVSSAPITQEELGKAEAPQAARVPQATLPPTGSWRRIWSNQEIKADLGKFSDDLDKYIDVLQGLSQFFELH
ncbi:hypothetical protein AAY473_013481 [Plecturocebus cupreus]